MTIAATVAHGTLGMVTLPLSHRESVSGSTSSSRASSPRAHAQPGFPEKPECLAAHGSVLRELVGGSFLERLEPRPVNKRRARSPSIARLSDAPHRHAAAATLKERVFPLLPDDFQTSRLVNTTGARLRAEAR
jgi:hypothetical protein